MLVLFLKLLHNFVIRLSHGPLDSGNKVVSKYGSLVNPRRFCPLTVLLAGFPNKFDLAFITKIILSHFTEMERN